MTQLTEQLIREYSSPASWERGLNYYRSGLVLGLEQRGTLLLAAVAGSEEDAYRVRVDVETLEAACSCPYDYGGWCKHIVAALLAHLRQPGRAEQKPSLNALIDPLPDAQVREALLHILLWHPETTETLEAFLEES